MTGGRPIISIRGLTRRFGERIVAVDDVSLDIREGEFFALLGPSGCGKTTLLRMIAGLEVASEGDILIDGEDMTGVPPNRRPVNMVFQSYAVFPHMTVFDNVAYGLKVTGVARREYAGPVEEALDLVKLAGLGARKPDQLSGGQRQRVALARALVKRPRVLLLDEPLSALDAKLREAMQMELVRLQHAVGITFVIVTHDQNEALSMADRIAVMEAGRIRQVAPPAELYEYPSCLFVADFIGRMNLFEGRPGARGEGEQCMVAINGVGDISLPVPAGAGDRIGVAVRPEKMRLHDGPPAEGEAGFRGAVTEIAYYGDTSFVFVRLDDDHIVSVHLRNEERSTASGLAVGDEVWCCWRPADMLVLDEEDGREARNKGDRPCV